MLMIAVVLMEHSSDETVFAQICLDGQFKNCVAGHAKSNDLFPLCHCAQRK